MSDTEIVKAERAKRVRAVALKAMADQFGVAVETLADDVTFESLYCDDLDVIELVMTLEDEFECDIADATYEDQPSKITVGSFIADMERNIA